MPKVVLDTNVLISAALFGGKPREILKLALEEKIQLYTSATLLSELQGVLINKFPLTFEQADEIEGQIRNLAKVVEPKTRVKKVKADPSDNRILEAALVAKANFIISGDKHLLALQKFKGIPILTPAEFLAWVV